MHAQILSGKPVADAILDSLKHDVAALQPLLVVVQVGTDPASSSYVKQKIKSCESVGMPHRHVHLPETTTKDALLAAVHALNEDPAVTGFIVQLPLPPHLKAFEPDIINAIRPDKDVDGFTTTNIGRMFLGLGDSPTPATPTGVLALLDFYGINVAGKNVVIVGRSNIVGKPLSIMLLHRGATVTICHSKTVDLPHITKNADVLCLAVGKARMLTASMVKKGAIVIDIGVSRVEGKLVGDADFDALLPIAKGITPVPGGIGPLTVASLIRNCVEAAKRKRGE